MQVLIDTQSALGVVDYASYVQFGEQTRIVRRLNEPSLCTIALFAGTKDLPAPQVLARVTIINASGLVLFTGYVSESPTRHVAGWRNDQDIDLLMLNAISDEFLLDSTQISIGTTFLGQTLGTSWNQLARLSARSLQVSLSEESTAAGRMSVREGSRWSEAAAALAAQTGNAYRCISGITYVAPLGQTTHVIAAGDPGLKFLPVSISDMRWLAWDVTVYGREEPTAYVTELFLGDGSTSSFVLTQQPFHAVSEQTTSFVDLFQGTSLNTALWQVNDPAAHIGLTQLGMTCNGGTGRDGEAVLSTTQQIELGGMLTFEAGGVSILPGSSGSMLGLYTGGVLLPNCFAGYQVSSSNQVVVLTAEVSGVSVGSTLTLQAGHIYTLRLRVYSPEMERFQQIYTTLTSKGLESFGGDLVSSTGQVVFEVEDVTSGVAGTTTILFSGSLNTLPPACIFGLIDSGNLNCSIRSIRCSQTSPLLVSTGPSATAQTPLSLATSADGGSCQVSSTGTLKFYPATVPASNELIFVSYRLRNLAVARQSLAFPAGETAIPVTLSWAGTVSEPIAWSSSDCDNVVSAILESVTDGPPALKGSYSVLSMHDDVWPGDLLTIGPQEDSSTVDVIVQVAVITLRPDVPETNQTQLDFATAALAGRGFRLTSTIPSDADLPQAPTKIKATLESLAGLSITSVTATELLVCTGTTAPTNGGFEVRRRDMTFGPGVDSDLVLRTAAANITIPRSYPVEQFYIRMYDACQPPNYSQFSAAVFLNLPLGG